MDGRPVFALKLPSKRVTLRRLAALIGCRFCGTTLTLMMLMLCVVTCASADDWKVRKFNARPETCFRAAELAVSKHHEVKFKDANLRVIRYNIGVTAWSYGYRMTLTIETSDEGKTCTAKTHVERTGGPVFSWGRGKKEVLKVYGWMEEELAQLLREVKETKGE